MLIIVSSTISPISNMMNLSLRNREEREKQYYDAIKKLLYCNQISKIVVCDNSNSHVPKEELLKEASANNKQIEFLAFEGNHAEVEQRGKGYGEGEIIDYALKNSSLIAGESWFIKITGRLYVKNMDSVLKRMNQKTNYLQTMYMNTRRKVMDTRFYACTIESYDKYFRNLYKEVDDANKLYIEKLFAQKIMNSDIHYRNMPVYPKIGGQSGSSGVEYQLSTGKYILKNVMSHLNLLKV